MPSLEERVYALELAVIAFGRVELGDVSGHAFHGNQYVDEGAPTPRGYYTIYHQTTAAHAKAIMRTGLKPSRGSDTNLTVATLPGGSSGASYGPVTLRADIPKSEMKKYLFPPNANSDEDAKQMRAATREMAHGDKALLAKYKAIDKYSDTPSEHHSVGHALRTVVPASYFKVVKARS